ncbi:hypothetical protein LG302_00855 [Halomonas organivorans]
MTLKLLIGLTGPARCGKTTAQRIIADRYGLARLALADPIKDALAAMLWLEPEALDGAAKERPLPWLGKSPRELMQTLGTEWGRDLVTQDLWLRIAEQRLAHLEDIEGDAYQGAVIGDIRFPDEAEWLRAHGGTLIHIHRQDVPAVRGHVSEAGVPHARSDRIVTNDGDLADLQERLTHIIDDVIDRRAA